MTVTVVVRVSLVPVTAATIVTCMGEVTPVGAVKTPLLPVAEMEPQEVPLQPGPLTVQVMGRFALAVADTLTAWPASMVAAAAVTLDKLAPG